jgi:hypothetical protein
MIQALGCRKQVNIFSMKTNAREGNEALTKLLDCIKQFENDHNS